MAVSGCSWFAYLLMVILHDLVPPTVMVGAMITLLSLAVITAWVAPVEEGGGDEEDGAPLSVSGKFRNSEHWYSDIIETREVGEVCHSHLQCIASLTPLQPCSSSSSSGPLW